MKTQRYGNGASWLGTLLGVLLAFSALAQDLPPQPNPPRLVNDFAGMLSGSERDILERKLVAFNDSTSNQVTIVIVKTTGDNPPGDYAFALGRAWGVGGKEKNNGVVILWATDDRKLFIAPGYGLEGALPDAICKRIVSNILAPNFKQEQYFTGLDQATDEIIRRASGEFKAEPKDTARDGSNGGFPAGLLMIIVLVIIAIIFFSNRNKGGGNRYRGGGGFFPPFVTFGGWGSSSGGGSWGGGGGGGGGFGGFGGGSFGGGGAGGDY